MAKVIINQTRLSNKKIRQIIRFVAPKDTKLPQIIIQNPTKRWVVYGKYHPEDDQAECYLKVAKYTEFPFFMEVNKKDRKKGYQSGFWLNNKEEALIYIAAHELAHCWQHQHPYPQYKRLGCRKNRYSESDADLYAIKKLNQWRQYKKNKV